MTSRDEDKAYAYARRVEAKRLYDRTTTRYADGVTRRKEWGGFAWFDMPAHTVSKMPAGERLQRTIAPVLDDVPIDHVDRVAWRGDDGRGRVPQTLNWDGAHIPWDAYSEAPDPEPITWRDTVQRMARDAYRLKCEIDSLETAVALVSKISPETARELQARADACAKRHDALTQSIGRICDGFKYYGTKADSDYADIIDRRWIGYARNIVEEHRAAQREAAAVAREQKINALSPDERQRKRALAEAKSAERKRKAAEERRILREEELAHRDRDKLCDHPITRWQVFEAASVLESRQLINEAWGRVDHENSAWLGVYSEWTKWIRENDENYKKNGKYFGAGNRRRI